jgi:hypothetical protein
MPTAKKISDKEAARALGRDEGAVWAVAALVNMYGTGTESMELAEAWGMRNLIAAADESDMPHLAKLLKDYPGKFRGCRRLIKSKKGKRRHA